eukprot:6197603-Pleurochrysis_carterae.AAC.2
MNERGEVRRHVSRVSSGREEKVRQDVCVPSLLALVTSSNARTRTAFRNITGCQRSSQERR